MRIDIFCDIVDNYGDAGVCWRLAKRFAQTSPSSYHDSIRLFCDDLNLLNLLAGGDAQAVAFELGIEILPWSASIETSSKPEESVTPDLVIEAFGCDLPELYLKKISSNPNCIILNLEYLSAEDWIESHHGLPSAGIGLKKYFFFPGFTVRSGRLLKGPLPTIGSPVPQSLLRVWERTRQDNQTLKICLFCYDTPEMQEFVQSLIDTDKRIDLLACQGQAQKLTRKLNLKASQDRCRVLELPFVSQEDFDWLLAHTDLNIVRGEDSFVRAQWAAKPMIWQIYPQQDKVHLLKLEAFLNKYCSKASAKTATLVREAMLMKPPSSWLDQLERLDQYAKTWRRHLEELHSDGDLAIQIREFLKKIEKGGKI